MFRAMTHEQPLNAFTLLMTKPPGLSVKHASGVLLDHYGMKAGLEPQDSERDQDLLLRMDADFMLGRLDETLHSTGRNS